MGSPIPEDYFAEDGQISDPLLKRFIRFVVQDAKRSFPGFRRHVTSRGTTLTAEAVDTAFRGMFTVRLRGVDTAVIGEGYVNGVIPRIGGDAIDGLDEDGERLKDGVPELDLSEGAGDRRRSYVCLRVRINPETGAMDLEDEESLTIAHVPTLHEKFFEGGAPDAGDVADWPIAQLHWNEEGDRITKVVQWIYFNLDAPVSGTWRGGGRGRAGITSA